MNSTLRPMLVLLLVAACVQAQSWSALRGVEQGRWIKLRSEVWP
jgi:hypothetical protein